MILHRIESILKLKAYIQADGEAWKEIKELAARQNAWFTPENIEASVDRICLYLLDEKELRSFSEEIHSKDDSGNSKTIGLVMAGNIPLVGFHDFLCIFLSGYRQQIKLSSKDNILLPHLIEQLYEINPAYRNSIAISEMLIGCDAYIATGSNNSARYFEQYFSRFPHIIRRNRTSVAILDGTETSEELQLLADDVYLYFGLGCRNVTKIYVPEQYDFLPLLNAFRKYDFTKDHNKYRNNLDYNLAVFILNNQFYMSNESLLLIENKALFSAVGVLHYEYYSSHQTVLEELTDNPDIQAITGHHFLPFGSLQTPGLRNFADGVNTIEFLNSL